MRYELYISRPAPNRVGESQAYSLYLAGALKMRKSFPAIWEMFNNVLNFHHSSIQSLAFAFQKVSFYNAKGHELECKS